MPKASKPQKKATKPQKKASGSLQPPEDHVSGLDIANVVQGPRKRRSSTMLIGSTAESTEPTIDVPDTPVSKRVRSVVGTPRFRLSTPREPSRELSVQPKTPALRLNPPKGRPDLSNDLLSDTQSQREPLNTLHSSMLPPPIPSQLRSQHGEPGSREKMENIARNTLIRLPDTPSRSQRSPSLSFTRCHVGRIPVVANNEEEEDTWASSQQYKGAQSQGIWAWRPAQLLPPDDKLFFSDEKSASDNEELNEGSLTQDLQISQDPTQISANISAAKAKKATRPRPAVKPKSPPLSQLEADQCVRYKIYRKGYVNKDVAGSNFYEDIKLGTLGTTPPLVAWKVEVSAAASQHMLDKLEAAHLKSVKAAAGYTGIPQNRKRPVDILDTQSWASIESELEDYRSMGKLLTVDLTYRFETSNTQSKKSTMTSGTGRVGLALPGSSFTSSQNLTANNATNALLIQRDATLAADPVKAKRDEISGRWACTKTNCGNWDGVCYIDQKGDHLKVDPVLHLRPWAGALLRDTIGRFTVEKPPASVLEKMYDGMKKKKSKQPNKEPNTPSHDPSLSQYQNLPPGYPQPYSLPPLPPIQQVQPQPSAPVIYNITYGPGGELQAQSRLSATPMRRLSVTPARYSSTPIPEDVPRSSPVDGELEEFIAWMKKKRPGNAKLFEEAYNKLIDIGYTHVDLFQRWRNDEEWVKRGILPGIGIQMAEKVSEWGSSRIIARSTRPLRATSELPTHKKIYQSIEHQPRGGPTNHSKASNDVEGFEDDEINTDNDYNNSQMTQD